MKIAIGCDHGGYKLKGSIKSVLESRGVEIIDFGTSSDEPVDYPDFAHSVAEAVKAGCADRGILICGTGIGMSIAANRHSGIRAALCHDSYTARLSREHNDSNLLCLGERVTGPGAAEEIVKIWIETEFAGGRHQRRIDKFDI